MVLVQGTVRVGKDGLRDLLAARQVMFTIWKSLWLDDGNKAILLADRRVAGENLKRDDFMIMTLESMTLITS